MGTWISWVGTSKAALPSPPSAIEPLPRPFVGLIPSNRPKEPDTSRTARYEKSRASTMARFAAGLFRSLETAIQSPGADECQSARRPRSHGAATRSSLGDERSLLSPERSFHDAIRPSRGEDRSSRIRSGQSFGRIGSSHGHARSSPRRSGPLRNEISSSSARGVDSPGVA